MLVVCKCHRLRIISSIVTSAFYIMAYQVPFQVGKQVPIHKSKLTFQLDDPSLLHFDSFVGNTWVQAKHGERFDVIGINALANITPHSTTC